MLTPSALENLTTLFFRFSTYSNTQILNFTYKIGSISCHVCAHRMR